jgi:hypothetical protein
MVWSASLIFDALLEFVVEINQTINFSAFLKKIEKSILSTFSKKIAKAAVYILLDSAFSQCNRTQFTHF